MQKWEYCVITGVKTGISGISGRYPLLSFISLRGVEKEIDLGNKAVGKRPDGFQKVSEGGYISHWIAKLGSEGWEMVSVVLESVSGPGIESHSIYFRREA